MQSGMGTAGIVAVPIPPGGAPGDVLTKLTAANYDTYWTTGGGGGGGSTNPSELAGAALMYLCDPESDPDAPPMPGDRGPQGAPGARGPDGPAVYMLQDDPDDTESLIPGPRGDAGAPGAQGQPGPALFMLQDDDEDLLPMVPGPRGETGPQGPVGSTAVIQFEDGSVEEVPLPLFPGDMALLDRIDQIFSERQIFENDPTPGSPRGAQILVRSGAGNLARVELRDINATADRQRYALVSASGIGGVQAFSDDGVTLRNVMTWVGAGAVGVPSISGMNYGPTQDNPLHTFNGALSESYTPGSFSILTGRFAHRVKRLELTGAQRVTLAGTARLRVSN